MAIVVTFTLFSLWILIMAWLYSCIQQPPSLITWNATIWWETTKFKYIPVSILYSAYVKSHLFQWLDLDSSVCNGRWRSYAKAKRSCIHVNYCILIIARLYTLVILKHNNTMQANLRKTKGEGVASTSTHSTTATGVNLEWRAKQKKNILYTHFCLATLAPSTKSKRSCDWSNHKVMWPQNKYMPIGLGQENQSDSVFEKQLQDGSEAHLPRNLKLSNK